MRGVVGGFSDNNDLGQAEKWTSESPCRQRRRLVLEHRNVPVVDQLQHRGEHAAHLQPGSVEHGFRV